jgi:hypothetical protein
MQSAAYSNRFSRKLIKGNNLNSFIDESNSTVFVTKTADEFIFKGYSDVGSLPGRTSSAAARIV